MHPLHHIFGGSVAMGTMLAEKKASGSIARAINIRETTSRTFIVILIYRSNKSFYALHIDFLYYIEKKIKLEPFHNKNETSKIFIVADRLYLIHCNIFAIYLISCIFKETVASTKHQTFIY